MIMNESSRSSDDPCLKEQHQQLAAVIKGLHKQLRRAYRENPGDHESVWEHHVHDSASLQQYAQAMHRLATEHWAIHPDTRIQWCRQVALEYFKGGGMRCALEKDLRRGLRKRHVKVSGQGSEMDHGKENSKIYEKKDVTSSELNTCASEGEKNLEEAMKNLHMSMKMSGRNRPVEEIIPAVKGRLRLLDVGSCYNPFLECPEFESIGIDLSPATQNVYQCDFLKLELTPCVQQADLSLNDLDPAPLASTLGLDPDPGSSTVTQLPRASFEVVVFSLLLEYLPAAVQRWACCVKAHSLLVQHGLLLIVTPDSNSAYRNAPMMKSWREALEHLGFHRWKYHKMEHVHCMAFRKVNDELPDNWPESVVNRLYIPQDFTDACYDDDHLPASERSSLSVTVADPEHEAELETFLLSSGGELPLWFSDDEDS